MDQTADSATTFCPADRRRYVLIAAILASSMGFIDGTVLAIATPAIRADLGAGLVDAQWVSNGYLLMLGALLLLGGAIGDRFGLKRAFSGGIAIFMLASVASALAPDAGLLIAARIVQGVGAALMVPGSLAIIAKAYPQEVRGAAIGTWAAAASLTTILGPIAGGLVLGAFGDWAWRLVFAINLPLGLLALLILWRYVPHDPPSDGRRLDVVGGILATLALGGIAYGLTGEGERGLVDVGKLLLFGGVGLVLGVAFIAWEARVQAPMLPLRLFRKRSFSGANGLTFALYAALGAIGFYLPMVLIGGFGVPAAMASVSMLPIGIALTVMSRFTGQLADRLGAGPPIAAGSLLVAVSLVWLGFTAAWGNVWVGVVPPMCLFGIGMGLVVSPLSIAVMTEVDDGDTGIASGVNNAVARVAGLFAVAVMGSLAATVFASLPATAGAGFGMPPPAGSDTAGVRAATEAAFLAVALASAALAALSAVIAWTTLERKSLSGSRS